MTKQDALVSIAQTMLRVRGADELVRNGQRPDYEQIRRAVAAASNLVNPTDEDCQYARLELDRRYTSTRPATIRNAQGGLDVA